MFNKVSYKGDITDCTVGQCDIEGLHVRWKVLPLLQEEVFTASVSNYTESLYLPQFEILIS